MNIAEPIYRVAIQSPDACAVVELGAGGPERRLSYDELAAKVNAVAAALLRLGLRRGDRVAMLMRNSPEYVQVFFGCAAAGVVAVPMSVRLLEAEHTHFVRDAEAALLIGDDDLLASRPALCALPGLVRVARSELERWAPDAPRVEPVAVEPQELFSLMYTSGTTGSPKGVMLSHRSWREAAEYVKEYLDYRDGERTLHVAALTHGAGFLMLPTFDVGGTNYVAAKFDARETLNWLGRHEITNFFLVPSMIRMLLNEHRGEKFQSLRSLYYAGSPIDQATLTAALGAFSPGVLVQSFAQMESPMFLTVMDRESHARIASGKQPGLIRSAGKACRGVSLRIVDDSGLDVPPGQLGEICARAPQMMEGYWRRADATASTLVDGWLHTGDIGHLDQDGNLFVVDRKKDMIISGGSNVYAREVEDVLASIAGVAEAAVVGLPDPVWGEAVTAFLVPSGAQRPTTAEIAERCTRELADYRRPKTYHWVETLPRNAYGKVLKRELRERALQGASK
ncbi:MAG: class I adenylate-forming enzyme family protein [Bradyrhizobium sp.]|jgi:acyl-CoA synthetase (AMP-forming)/AMP-acid ligase II|uniref:AMP-binding protein n=1 Tax=Caenimonas koreensis DSM 17982 TaxID=1121255 RepID=A0A844BGY1_9BURK|nr:AMP-binding protein [Caenimonas koreensis]ART89969.1 long-chain-fatty-acid--CoA ligase [uncultured bacterium]MRD49701.1 AMP-binding protein [Caenimonas koreensis DSM 17982]